MRINSLVDTAELEKAVATLSPEEKQRINTMPTNNLEAYDAYLRGRQLTATRDSEQLQLATEEFNKKRLTQIRYLEFDHYCK